MIVATSRAVETGDADISIPRSGAQGEGWEAIYPKQGKPVSLNLQRLLQLII